MFGIGTSELVLILVIVLILFGPSKLPELAKSIGRIIHDLRHSTAELKQEINKQVVEGESEKNNNKLDA